MDVVQALGLDVAYERVGQGPPLVLVHGAAEDGRVWRPQLTALADEFTVVAWDEPGTGRSGDLPAGFGMEDYAHCLAAVIEAVGLGPAHVLGFSWGGNIVQGLYRHRPEVVSTLILSGTSTGWKGSLSEDEVRARVEGFGRMLAAAAVDGFEAVGPGLFAGEPPEDVLPLMEAMAADVRGESMRTAVRVMADTDERTLLGRITVPTLLIWGEFDTRSPLGVGRRFEQAIPEAELVVIPGAGHLGNLEAPAAFNDAVRAFCRAHPPLPPSGT
jgi:pimeloyl-ACP methyl ester carboxylesterase